MAVIQRVCYASRDDAVQSIDFKPGIDANSALDRALTSATDNIEGNLHRRFYPNDLTKYFDWPNQGGSGGGQYANPWTMRFDEHDIVVLTALSAGTVSLPLNTVFLEPVNKKPGFPFTYIELDRSSTSYFGGTATPQHSVIATGTWGFTADADQVATLSANIASGDTSFTVSNGALVGAGDLIIVGYGRAAAPYPSAAGYAGALGAYTGERILVTDKTLVSTSLTQSGTGCTTASAADNQLAYTGAGNLSTGEIVQDSGEQMLVTVGGSSPVTVIRAWAGTTLATHTTGFTVNAFRSLTVARGQYGTTAASATGGTAVFKHRVPSLVRDLCIAEATNRILQEGSGYSRQVAAGAGAHPAPGIALMDLWDEALTVFGRKARSRAV